MDINNNNIKHSNIQISKSSLGLLSESHSSIIKMPKN